MAQTETGNDCEGDASTRNYEDTETGPEKRPSPVPSNRADIVESRGAGSLRELGSGARVQTSSKKSRRKQRDPRRLGSDVVQISMPVTGIKSEPREIDNDHGDVLVMGNGAADFDDDDDDDVFSSIRNKALSSIADEEDLSIAESESKLTSRGQRILNCKLDFGNNQIVKSGGVGEGDEKVQGDNGTSDCQSEPEDLSIGRRKRGRVDNRVPLAIPSLMTTPGTKTSELRNYFANHGLSSPMTKHLSGSTLPNKRLSYRDEGNGDPVSDGDRLKFNHLVYSEDFHEAKSPARDRDHHQSQALVVHHGPSFALLREHNIALDPDDCNSPELPFGHRKDGKVSPSTSASSSSSTSPSSKTKHGHSPPRTYKNLTRSRRIVANARERNRVHTISAAFEGLRRAVPSYSHNQKLSKLAILRIACSYILALSKLADLDYSSDDQTKMSFEDCVDLCTETLQAEGRSKRRKGQME